MSAGDDRAAEAAEAQRQADEYAAEFARIAPELIRPPRPPMTEEEEAEFDEMMRDLDRMFNDDEEDDR